MDIARKFYHKWKKSDTESSLTEWSHRWSVEKVRLVIREKGMKAIQASRRVTEEIMVKEYLQFPLDTINSRDKLYAWCEGTMFLNVMRSIFSVLLIKLLLFEITDVINSLILASFPCIGFQSHGVIYSKDWLPKIPPLEWLLVIQRLTCVSKLCRTQ